MSIILSPLHRVGTETEFDSRCSEIISSQYYVIPTCWRVKYSCLDSFDIYHYRIVRPVVDPQLCLNGLDFHDTIGRLVAALLHLLHLLLSMLMLPLLAFADVAEEKHIHHRCCRCWQCCCCWRKHIFFIIDIAVVDDAVVVEENTYSSLSVLPLLAMLLLLKKTHILHYRYCRCWRCCCCYICFSKANMAPSWFHRFFWPWYCLCWQCCCCCCCCWLSRRFLSPSTSFIALVTRRWRWILWWSNCLCKR